MSLLEIAFGVILIVLAVAVTAVVLFQEGHQRPMETVIGASNDTFLIKNKKRSIDAFLERWTRNISVSFFLVVMMINIILFFRLV